MTRDEEIRADTKLDLITQHLLKAFPAAVTVCNQDSQADSLLTVCPSNSGRKHTLHIAKAFLTDVHPAVQAIPSLLDRLKLATVLSECDRYMLTHGSCAPSRLAGLRPEDPSAYGADDPTL